MAKVKIKIKKISFKNVLGDYKKRKGKRRCTECGKYK